MPSAARSCCRPNGRALGIEARSQMETPRLRYRRRLSSERPSMRILVTGSAGHLGEALMRVLSSSEHEAIGIDVLPSPYTHRVGSIADREFVRSCMQGMHAV